MNQTMPKFNHIGRILVLFLLFMSLSASALPVYANSNGWVKKDNKTYYYENNKPVTGYHTIGDDGYYFDQNGVMKTGQISIKGKKYYFNSKTGKMTFGWVTIRKKSYYYSINGTVGTHVKVNSVKGKYSKGSIYGSKLSKSQLKSIRKKVITFINTKIATNMTAFEKITAANDYISNNCRYKSGSNSGTAYGALVRKKAVCTGYSRAFLALCDAMGIKAKLVHATNFTHTWNVVKIGSKWYHIDVQTNDSCGAYVIFLVSDSYLKKAKIKWSKKTPTCSKNYTYTISLPKEGTL